MIYSKINVPYKFKKVVDNLSKNENIVILKQDKGRGVVILDTTKYPKRCMALLNTDRFKKVITDSTTAIDRKKEKKSFEKNKTKFPEQE